MSNYNSKNNYPQNNNSTNKSNSNSSNSTSNGHCPNCNDDEKTRRESECPNGEGGGTPGHRGEQKFFPSLETVNENDNSATEELDEEYPI